MIGVYVKAPESAEELGPVVEAAGSATTGPVVRPRLQSRAAAAAVAQAQAQFEDLAGGATDFSTSRTSDSFDDNCSVRPSSLIAPLPLVAIRRSAAGVDSYRSSPARVSPSDARVPSSPGSRRPQANWRAVLVVRPFLTRP